MVKSTIEKAFFGDVEQHKEVIGKLTATLSGQPGEMHLLMGGYHSGKTSLLKEVQKSLGKESYIKLHEAGVMLQDKFVPAREAILKITLPYERKPGDLRLLGGTTYKKGSHYVLFLNEPYISKSDNIFGKLEKLIGAHRNLNETARLSIVVDYPLAHEFPLPEMQSEMSTLRAQHWREALKQLSDAYPALHVTQMRYDRRQTLQSLHDAMHDTSPKAVHSFMSKIFGLDKERYTAEQFQATIETELKESGLTPNPDSGKFARPRESRPRGGRSR